MAFSPYSFYEIQDVSREREKTKQTNKQFQVINKMENDCYTLSFFYKRKIYMSVFDKFHWYCLIHNK